MKKFILNEDGSIRDCTYNESLMNPIGWSIFKIKHTWRSWGTTLIESYSNLFYGLWASLANTFLVLFFPVVFPLIGIYYIHVAKQQVKLMESMNEDGN